MDLITVLMRQLRVALGEQVNLSGNQGWLMQNTLGVGTRRAPALRGLPGVRQAGQQTFVRQTNEQTQFVLGGSASQREFKQQPKFTPRASSPGTLADVMLNIGTLPAGEVLRSPSESR